MFGSGLFTNKTVRRRFGQQQSGSAAAEFAIVLPVFLMTMFSIFEVGWFYYVNSIVDASVTSGARLIRTGQLQSSSTDTDDQFDDLYDGICDVLDTFGDCDSRLTVEVKTYATFAELAADTTDATCADASSTDIDSIPFSPGGELEIVRVRICYMYTTLNPAIGVNLSEAGGSTRKLISTMIFRNEPYETNV